MFTILVENQTVKLKWIGATKKHYEDKGYKFTKLFDEFIVKVEDLTNGSNKKVQCICDYCGSTVEIPYNKYLMQTNNKTEKYACKQCIHKKIKDLNNGIHPNSEKFKGQNNIPIEEVIRIVESKNNNKLLNPEDYINVKENNLRIVCGSCGKEFITSLASIKISGGRCKDCGFRIGGQVAVFDCKYVEEYINSINNNKLLNPNDYINSNVKNLNIKCGNCGKIYTTSFSKYKNANQTVCPSCSHKQRGIENRLPIDVVKEIIDNVNNNILLNPEEYVGNSVRNLKIKCGECGQIFTTSLVNYQSGTVRCSTCSKKKTRGERTIENYFVASDIKYEYQKKFVDCKDRRSLPFDFYLPSRNICVEFDGRQHFEPVFGQDSFEKTQLHDQIKNDYCEHNDIKLIRIPYWEGHNIEKILTKELHI